MRCGRSLKELAESEVDLTSSIFAQAADRRERPQDRIHNQAGRDRLMVPLADEVGADSAISPSDVVPATQIDLAARQRRQFKDLVEIAAGGQQVLVTSKLVPIVGSQPEGSAQRELLRPDILLAERKASGADEKDDAGVGDGMKD